MEVTAVWHEAFYMHEPDTHHPENPSRLDLALQGARLGGARVERLECLGDPWRAYRLVHEEAYLDRIRLALEEASLYGTVWLDPDTYVSEGTGDALSALACTATTMLERAGAGRAHLVLGRPPGHHAGRSGAALGAPTLGFCLLNTAALLAASLEGSLVFDFDVHHGNGTQEILGRLGVPHVDIHQDPTTIYPGTGMPWEAGPSGTWYNIPVPPRARDDILLDALQQAFSLIQAHSPRTLIVSMGFDGMDGDNAFASLKAGPRFYYEAGALLSSLGVPVIAVLEGGYGKGLVEGLAWFVRGLRGEEPPPPANGESPGDLWAWYRRLLARAHWLPGQA